MRVALLSAGRSDASQLAREPTGRPSRLCREWCERRPHKFVPIGVLAMVVGIGVRGVDMGAAGRHIGTRDRPLRAPAAAVRDRQVDEMP